MLWFYGFKLECDGGSVTVRPRPTKMHNSLISLPSYVGFRLPKHNPLAVHSTWRDHLNELTYQICKGDNWAENFSNWDVRMDHNHLRITRIIRSLRVLGLEDEAHAFRAALEEYTTNTGNRSREFWRRAAQRSLNLRPDVLIVDESTDSIGPEFLQEFERNRKATKAAEMEQAIESESTDSGSGPPAKKQKSYSKHVDNGSHKSVFTNRVWASLKKLWKQRAVNRRLLGDE